MTNVLSIKVKKLSDKAIVPSFAHTTDAGLDLTATSIKYDEFDNVVYGTSLAFAIPDNHVGLLFPRSSNAKKDLLLSNSVGVVDAGYRGEVFLKFKKTCGFIDNDSGSEYNIGDRVGQLIILPIPKVNLELVDDLDDTDRGVGAYGSSGK